MVDCAEEEWKLLKAAFTWLEDRGVGGKKVQVTGALLRIHRRLFYP